MKKVILLLLLITALLAVLPTAAFAADKVATFNVTMYTEKTTLMVNQAPVAPDKADASTEDVKPVTIASDN